MLLGKCANRRNLIVSPLNRARPATSKQLRFHPDREELCVEISGLRAYGVEVAIAQLLLDIDVFVKQSLRSVHVHIDSDGALMD